MSTYTPIATQTLASTASSVTLSSIPQGYTDLVLVVAGNNSSSTYSPYIQFNGDTSTNYSITSLYGDGSNAASARASNTATAYFGSLSATQGNAIVQIQNYSNTTTYKTALIRINAAVFRVYASVMLWRSTAAITSLTVFNESPGTFASGTTFSLYGIAAGSTKAQGGIVTNDGTYYYHTFLSSGVFTPNQALTCDYLVVAGGGGGSKGYGAGGGAGGLLSSVTATGGGGTLQSALSVTAQPYSIIVGAGGPSMTNGSNSIFSTVTSIGGGKGGDFATNGSTGGSGGGGGVSNSGTTTGGAGTVNQGYAGGTNGGFSSSPYGSGGGGGAGAVGGNAASASINGNGGVGLQLTAWATSTNTGANSGYYAGGGGGDSYLSGNTAGTGGLGGGGAGGGNSGTNNTGGGGGGNNNSLQTLGGSGGSGIVIVRYAI
jgi:hypothetical protein